MHKALLASLLTWALALAGCSGGSEGHGTEPVTCADGTMLTDEQIEAHPAHHADGFDPMTLCPVAPSVTLSGLPATIQVFDSASFTWAVDAGSAAKGHSMLTSIRYAKTSIPDAELVEGQMAKYPTEIIKKEHQDLPVTFKGNMTFNQPGKVYVRAYAQVQGEGLQRRDVWSSEIVLDVLPVTPTGAVVTITHSPGLAASTLESAQETLVLGDAIQFTNQEVMELTLSQASAPAGAPACELTAGTGATSTESCVLVVPGTYQFETNDVGQMKSVTLTVAKA